MTVTQGKQIVGGWLASLKEWSPIVTCVIAAIYFGSGLLTGLVGPLRPQTQIDQDTLRSQLASLQATSDRIIARLDALPRPSDYQAQDQHLGRIDGALAALGDRLTQDEIGVANVKGRVDTLWSGTASQIRNPPR